MNVGDRICWSTILANRTNNGLAVDVNKGAQYKICFSQGASVLAKVDSVLLRSANSEVRLLYWYNGQWVEYGKSSCSISGKGSAQGTRWGLNIGGIAGSLSGSTSHTQYVGCVYATIYSGSASGSASYEAWTSLWDMSAMNEAQYNAVCKGKLIYCTPNGMYETNSSLSNQQSLFNTYGPGRYRHGQRITASDFRALCSVGDPLAMPPYTN